MLIFVYLMIFLTVFCGWLKRCKGLLNVFTCSRLESTHLQYSASPFASLLLFFLILNFFDKYVQVLLFRELNALVATSTLLIPSSLYFLLKVLSFYLDLILYTSSASLFPLPQSMTEVKSFHVNYFDWVHF